VHRDTTSVSIAGTEGEGAKCRMTIRQKSIIQALQNPSLSVRTGHRRGRSPIRYKGHAQEGRNRKSIDFTPLYDPIASQPLTHRFRANRLVDLIESCRFDR